MTAGTWEIAARTEITHLHALYVRTIDSPEPSDLSPLFHADGMLISRITGKKVCGRAQLAAYISELRKTRTDQNWSGINHFLTPPLIDLHDQRSADAQCYFVAYNRSGPDHWGTYVDRVEKRGGDWLFAAKSISLLGATPGGWVGSGAVRLGDEA